jgi:hypothetical protein
VVLSSAGGRQAKVKQRAMLLQYHLLPQLPWSQLDQELNSWLQDADVDPHALLFAFTAPQGEFDDAVDFFYNAYTTTDYLTFEDCHEDWTLFSKLYLQRWQQQGVDGIKQLRAHCNDNLTSLMRGLDGKKLEHAWSTEEPRVSAACALMVCASSCCCGMYLCLPAATSALAAAWSGRHKAAAGTLQ